MIVTGDVACQRDGVDRVIVLANGKVLKIDEKKREREYSDILLEYISSDARGTPGWIEKDLPIDYLSYAFMPIQTAYLFPWDMLRRAWLYYKPKWIVEHKRIEAQNNGYRTISVAVPIQTVKAAVALAMVITLEGK